MRIKRATVATHGEIEVDVGAVVVAAVDDAENAPSSMLEGAEGA